MGNYHSELEGYNPTRLAMYQKYNDTKMPKAKPGKYAKFEANLIIFNHVHSKLSGAKTSNHSTSKRDTETLNETSARSNTPISSFHSVVNRKSSFLTPCESQIETLSRVKEQENEDSKVLNDSRE